MSMERKRELVGEWWGDYKFHLALAVREPDELNLFMGDTLSPELMELLHRAKQKGIPFFVTPYYLSLLSVRTDGYDDSTIRSYVIYSEELVENFGLDLGVGERGCGGTGKTECCRVVVAQCHEYSSSLSRSGYFHPGFDGTGLWAVRFMPAYVRLSERTFEF